MSEERLQMIKKMLENNPDDSFLNYAAALEYNKRGMTDKAMELLNGIVAMIPFSNVTRPKSWFLAEKRASSRQSIDTWPSLPIVYPFGSSTGQTTFASGFPS